MDKCKVKLNICGTSYTVTSDDTEEYMFSIGEKVDKKVKDILSKNPHFSVLMAAELAALEYCDLLSKSNINIENLRKELNGYTDSLNDLKESLEIKNLEIDDLNNKIKDYENRLKLFERKNEALDSESKKIVTESKECDENNIKEEKVFSEINKLSL